MAIPSLTERNLEQGGILRTMAIDLSDHPEDRAAVIEVLRSKLYSNKILAPIREYATNAMDAHVEAGIADRPIRVTLPSIISPELRIRDFGTGLNPDEVEAIYIKYGRSTKRTTNSQTGQLGLGCKSAFAYGDNFVVIAYNNGVRTTYNLTINGVCTILASEPTEEPSGMEVVVPVNVSDVQQFQKECVTFFEYWKIQPIIVGGDADCRDKLSSKDTSPALFEGENWEIRPASNYYGRNTESRIIMGNIPYPVDFDIVSSKMSNLSKNEILFDFIKSNKTVMWFGVGKLDFSASRESLEYTEKTCESIVAKIKEITSNIFNILEQKIATAKTYWEALMIYSKIFGSSEEKLFAGDLSRLEGVYRGKFRWNGIAINSGSFTELHRWDSTLGFYNKGNWSLAPAGSSIHNDNFNLTPVLTTFTVNYNGRLKKSNPSEYGHNTIVASTKVAIVINDSAKPVGPDTVARWMFNRNPITKPTRLYHLKFRDKTQEAEFFAATNFESAPVVRTSDNYTEIKTWLKAQRAATVTTKSTQVGNTRTPIRCLTPANRKGSYGYMNSTNWGRKDIDIYEESGYYMEIEGEEARINNHNAELSYLTHNSWVLFQALGMDIPYIYGFPRKNYEAKWFGEATEDGQWVKLEEYFKGKKDDILNGKTADVAKAAAYYKTFSDGDGCIGIAFAINILPLLTNKNGAMYKICLEISKDFEKHKELIGAMEYFGITADLHHTGIDFKKSVEEVKASYPMLSMLNDSRQIFNQDGECKKSTFLNTIATYVNMVDSENNSGDKKNS